LINDGTGRGRRTSSATLPQEDVSFRPFYHPTRFSHPVTPLFYGNTFFAGFSPFIFSRLPEKQGKK
jgi:hypothetical protein